MRKKIFSFFKSKYTITFLALAAWLLFFDKNDLQSQLQLTRKLAELEAEKQYYLDQIVQIKTDMQELKTNPNNLEKFAREKYLMKKDNEDIFVLVKE